MWLERLPDARGRLEALRAPPPGARSRGFHALRHAFDTRMYDVIDNPLIAMRATGHDTRVGVEKVRDALERLG
jgi:integrase